MRLPRPADERPRSARASPALDRQAPAHSGAGRRLGASRRRERDEHRRPASAGRARAGTPARPRQPAQLRSIKRTLLMPTMRLPNIAHTSRPWGIHELTRDFRLEDVWALPTAGDRYDFARPVRLIASGDRPGLFPRRAHAVGDPVKAR